MNTLNDDDVLTGKGDNPTLNFTYVDDTDGGVNLITPTLNGIETINVDVVGMDAVRALDLQDATGVQNVNVARINANTVEYRTQNITEALSSMSVNNSHAEAALVGFDFLNSALSGAADEADVTLNNAALGALRIEAASEGYETLNLSSVGSANAVNVLRAEDLETLNIAGDQDLVLGGSTVVRQIVDGRVEAENYQAGLANVIGSLSVIDASGLTGDIQIHLGAEVTATRDNTSGVPVDFTYTGAQGDDVVILTGGMNAGDTIDGGEGDNTVVVTANAAAGTLSNFQNLFVKGQGVGATAITVDTATLADLETVVIRNEGQDDTVTPANPTGQWIAAAQNLTTTLNNVSETVAQDIILQHGNSGNNGIAANVVNVNTVAAATSVGITLVDGVNVDPRFNATLNTSNNVDNVSITDNDSESNTVRLGNVANIDGSITLTGGAAGQFMNLDVQNVLPAGRQAGLYGYQTDGTLGSTIAIPPTADNAFVTDIGAVGAARLEAATIDAAAYAGNVVVRVSDADNATGAQTITMGAGNDTVIFDDLNDNTAGLTISDVVDGGAGNDTLAIDGDGVRINISASEWTNVSNFETIHLVGNGMLDANGRGAVNAYNLTLTNDLIAANGSAVTGGRSIAIVNDNGANAAASANAGVTIDARTLNAQSSFSYDGQETDAAVGTTMTADRFIMADANINGLAVIDGGADVTGGATPGYSANADVLEVRNAAVVTIGDLAGVSNVGTIEFTNDTAVDQRSNLVLDSATVDRLVNTTNNATLTNTETLAIRAFDNVLVGADTALVVDARQVGGQFALNIDTTGTGANAGDDTVQSAINVGGATQVIDLGGQTATGVTQFLSPGLLLPSLSVPPQLLP
ncbi:beta strand repeat-containing protein [Neopusillimonas aromaticivorans]|uniref:beta strand repeat-containing protein n=1 Tax=Neopusillimonas aromaticivorans TaxID=2979868 RepID=UPI002599E796|nr:hypothetical protein [Neopusillimonas aromaticivorans]WJJ94739.1 hypothetical protein N7E01_07515 [Neopusillimonas aromaticivorans]